MLDPYKRLLAYFDEQLELGAAGAYDPTPVLYRPGCADSDAPAALRDDVYVTTLTLPGTVGLPVLVWAEDMMVAWFELKTLDDQVHHITIDRKYHPDDERAIAELLLEAGV